MKLQLIHILERQKQNKRKVYRKDHKLSNILWGVKRNRKSLNYLLLSFDFNLMIPMYFFLIYTFIFSIRLFCPSSQNSLLLTFRKNIRRIKYPYIS